jgi:hypothetical protein
VIEPPDHPVETSSLPPDHPVETSSPLTAARAVLLWWQAEAQTGLSLILVCIEGLSKGQTLSVPCLGANRLMGEREVGVASRLLDAGASANAHNERAGNAERVGQCLLQLEIPIDVNRRVARHAAQSGVFVGLKTSPLDARGADELRTLLADGTVRLLVMQAFEVIGLDLT